MPTDVEIWQAHPTVTIREDRIGNLHLWQGENAGKDTDGALVQDSQDIAAALEYTNITQEDREELSKGYPVTIKMYDECFCVLFEIEF